MNGVPCRAGWTLVLLMSCSRGEAPAPGRSTTSREAAHAAANRLLDSLAPGVMLDVPAAEVAALESLGTECLRRITMTCGRRSPAFPMRVRSRGSINRCDAMMLVHMIA